MPAFEILSIIARLKLRLSLRYYQRNWGNAIAVGAVMLVLLGAAVFGAVTLYFFVHSANSIARDTAFFWAAWLITAIWLTAPLTQFDAQNNLDLNGLRLFPLTNASFSAAALLDGLLSPLGLFIAPLGLGLVAALTMQMSELPWILLSVLLFAIALLGLSQAIVLWTNHLMQSRRFADASIVVTIILFVAIQSINLFVQQQDQIGVPGWLMQALTFTGLMLKPLLDWLFPGLAASAFSLAIGGETAGAAMAYGLLTLQAGVAVWLAGVAARQFYSGELESGGTVKARPSVVNRNNTRAAIGGVLGALIQRERVYLWRDPLLKLMFIQSLFSMLFVSAMLVMNILRMSEPGIALPDYSNYIVLGMAMMLSFIESGLLFNKFGIEGLLFTSVLLSPVDRRSVLTAKSVFYLLHFGTLNIVLMVAISIALHAPLIYAVGGTLIVAFNTMFVDLIGHFVSILYPFTYRRSGRRLRAVMAQPGCGYMLLYMVVFNMCNLIVLPGSAALIAGLVLGGWAGLACGASVYAVLLAVVYHYSLPYAAQLLVRREPELVALLSRSQQ